MKTGPYWMALAFILIFCAYTNSVYAPDWLIPLMWLILLVVSLLLIVLSGGWILLDALRHPEGNPVLLSMGHFRRREIIAHMHSASRERCFHQRS